MKNNSAQQGFLLLEALISLALLFVGVLATNEAFSRSRDAARRAEAGRAILDLSRRTFIDGVLHTSVFAVSERAGGSVLLERSTRNKAAEGVRWTVSWKDSSGSREERFETVRSRQ